MQTTIDGKLVDVAMPPSESNAVEIVIGATDSVTGLKTTAGLRGGASGLAHPAPAAPEPAWSEADRTETRR